MNARRFLPSLGFAAVVGMFALCSAPAFASTTCVNASMATEVLPCDIDFTTAGGHVMTITFSGFTSTGLNASQIQMNVDNSAYTGAGFTFAAVAPGGFFPPVGSLSYTATIKTCPAGYTCALTSTVAQLFAPLPTTAQVTTNFSSTILTGINLTGTTSLPNVQSVTMTATFNANGSGGPSFEADVMGAAISQTPEPSSLLLFGSGLLLLGFVIRRRPVRS